jgi:hypothetical protein
MLVRVSAWLAVSAAPLAAQIDYRNLDEGRPSRVEDAYPVERYAFELLLPYSLERERGGATVHVSELELAYGLIRNAHLGIKAPLAVLAAGGATDWGLAGIQAFALYNFNTEVPLLPAISLRADLRLPVGSLAGSETRFALTAILTRSWGRSRVHLNGGYGFGPDESAAAVETLDRWWAGAALDRTFFRTSLLIVAAASVQQAASGGDLEVTGELGARYQWRPSTVFDVGVGREFRGDAGPEIALTIGFSQAFAFAALMPSGR